MDIKKIITIHQLIKLKRTGKPKLLAEKLGFSERTTYNYINYMKIELKAPIKWSSEIESYVYESNGNLNFDWQE